MYTAMIYDPYKPFWSEIIAEAPSTAYGISFLLKLFKVKNPQILLKISWEDWFSKCIIISMNLDLTYPLKINWIVMANCGLKIISMDSYACKPMKGLACNSASTSFLTLDAMG